MAKWDITGEWSGEYAYDPDPAIPTLPPATPFTLVARLGWFGRFRGTAEDGPGGPPEGSAAVAGRVAGDWVTFRKQYPVHYVEWDGRWATLREFLEGEHGLPLDRDVPPEPIWYAGEYDPDGQAVRGTWRIEDTLIEFWSRGQPHVWEWPGASGTWVMRRQ